ncbi:hypothetical protein [Streptomyces sp. NPDC056883]|uniref:hypothetical protein n=1 Tax=Streptomyces sp. NPDC056883 TaxID=3345959 RepID=UPI0036A3C395
MSTLPDPEEFMNYLEECGFNAIDAQMNEVVNLYSKSVTKAGELKKHARSVGFSYEAAEEIAMDFHNTMTKGAGK